MNANLNRSLLFLVSVFSFVNMMAQTGINISGKTIDLAKQNIIGARICLIQGRDSICTMSNEEGKFQLTNINKNNFIIKVYALGYLPWSKEYNQLNNLTENIFLEISMQMKTNMLKEFIVKATLPIITLKRDTIEYNIENFKLRKNSVLNDILKRLPGLTVEENGSITYLGNKISKIKINGQEIALDNIKDLMAILSTDVLEKIQLIDDYGDLSQITGRKIGIPDQILNIKTKDEFKLINQINVNLGLGNNNRRELSAKESRILPDKQLYITLNNNNTNLNDPGDKAYSLAHISYIKSSNVLTVRSNLSMKKNEINNKTSQNSQTITTQGEQASNNLVNANEENDSKTFYAGIDYKNKNKLLSSVFHGELNKSKDFTSITSNQNGLQHLFQSMINTSKENNQYFDHFSSFSSPLNNKGRLLTISDYINYSNSDKFSNYYTSTKFYYLDSTNKDSIINQILKSNLNSITLSGQSTLIEPINQKSNIEIGYKISFSKNVNNLKTYINEDSDQKEILIDSLSSNYQYAIKKNEFTANYKYSSSKIIVIIGGNYTFYNFKLSSNAKDDISVKGAFFSPIISVELKNSKSQLNFTNSTATIFPTYQQVQPVTNRIAIQNPIFGNPLLKPQTNYIFTIGYRNIGKVMVLFKITPQISLNKISTNVILSKDSLNNIVQSTHYINTNGNFNIGLSGGIYKQFNSNKIQFAYEFKNSFDNNIIYLDNLPHKVRTINIGQNIKGKIFKDWIECTGVINYEYNKNSYLSYTNSISTYKSLNFLLSTKIYFLKTWTIWYDIKKQLNFGLNYDLATNPLLLNGGIEKSFIDNRISVKFQAINILNQTALISQSISGNTILETKNNNIGNYYLLSILLNLKKMNNQ